MLMPHHFVQEERNFLVFFVDICGHTCNLSNVILIMLSCGTCMICMRSSQWEWWGRDNSAAAQHASIKSMVTPMCSTLQTTAVFVCMATLSDIVWLLYGVPFRPMFEWKWSLFGHVLWSASDHVITADIHVSFTSAAKLSAHLQQHSSEITLWLNSTWINPEKKKKR